mmetsp:Transcript_74294/g.117131  ORF Transcript_74294/g.117131 Transcript_74294/m.117131 type:complete len:83 (-) Transcript_74294:461-709(-)
MRKCNNPQCASVSYHVYCTFGLSGGGTEPIACDIHVAGTAELKVRAGVPWPPICRGAMSISVLASIAKGGAPQADIDLHGNV